MCRRWRSHLPSASLPSGLSSGMTLLIRNPPPWPRFGRAVCSESQGSGPPPQFRHRTVKDGRHIPGSEPKRTWRPARAPQSSSSSSSSSAAVKLSNQDSSSPPPPLMTPDAGAAVKKSVRSTKVRLRAGSRAQPGHVGTGKQTLGYVYRQFSRPAPRYRLAVAKLPKLSSTWRRLELTIPQEGARLDRRPAMSLLACV